MATCNRRLRPFFSWLPLAAALGAAGGCGRPPPPPAPPSAELRPFAIDGVGLEMEPIPAGTFLMGSPPDEPGRDVCEGPQTQVSLTRPFWLGRTAVTHGQWKAVMGTDLEAQARKAAPDNADPSRLLANTDDAVAMYYVNWHEAQAFCDRLNRRAGLLGHAPAGYVYRLPTEAEWEYACRAGTETATYAGSMPILGRSDAPALDPIAWYGGNSSVGYAGPGWDTADWTEKEYPGGLAGPRDAGLKEPNAWGLCDMLGNLYQWCIDFPAPSLPGGSVADPSGLGRGSDRAVRGGCWHSDAAFCRSASRAWNVPDARTIFVGFRVALAPAIGR